MAPTGSESPDRKDILNAFFLSPVAKYIGTETAIPSGILWIAIATAMLIPIVGSWSAPAKVASPSGKLCIAMASAENIPILSSSFSFIFFPFSSSVTSWISCGFSPSGTSLSIAAIIPIPTKKAIVVIQ